MAGSDHLPKVGCTCRLPFTPRNRFARQLVHRWMEEHPFCAERMMALAIKEHLRSPSKRYELFVYQELSRSQLNQAIREFFEGQKDGLCHSTLDDEIMSALEPREDKQPQPSDKVLVETFFPPLYEPTNSVQARDILRDMGFQSTTTQRALSHALHKDWWRLIDGKRVVVLDAKYQDARKGERKFLEFSMGEDKRMRVQLHEGNYFDAHVCFLVERINPLPKPAKE